MIVPNDSHGGDESGDNDYVLLENYPTLISAEVAKSTLELGGIQSEIFDGETASINWLYTNAIGGVKLMVRQGDLSSAREILNSETGVEDTIVSEADEINETSVYCSKCHSMDIEIENIEKAQSSFSIVNLLRKGFGSTKTMRCRNCGNSWNA